MKLAVASDHAGYTSKAHLVAYLTVYGHAVLDLGVQTDATRADYPDTVAAVADAVEIVICF